MTWATVHPPGRYVFSTSDSVKEAERAISFFGKASITEIAVLISDKVGFSIH